MTQFYSLSECRQGVDTSTKMCYNICIMKKDGSNVIQFPKPSVNKIEDMEEYDLETTYHIFDIV